MVCDIDKKYEPIYNRWNKVYLILYTVDPFKEDVGDRAN